MMTGSRRTTAATAVTAGGCCSGAETREQSGRCESQQAEEDSGGDCLELLQKVSASARLGFGFDEWLEAVTRI